MPKASRSTVSLAAVGTPFYCYSTATLTRHYQVFAGAFADVPSLVCYAMKANSNQAVITTLARLGAGADVVSGGELKRALRRRHPGRQDHVLRRRQDARASSPPRSMPASSASMSSPSRSSSCCRRSPPARGARAAISLRVNPDVDAAHPRQDRDRQGGEQVRHSDQPRARGLCARRQAAGPARRRRRHAYRQPDHRAGAVRRRLRAAVGVRAHAARRRPRDRRMSISAAGSASRIATTTSRRHARRLCGSGQARDPRARLHAGLRARPADRRQCRHPGDAGRSM